jgi:hypothetical protein
VAGAWTALSQIYVGAGLLIVTKNTVALPALLGVFTHGHHVVVAQVAVDEGQQVALGMFVVELFDDLRGQFLRRSS